MPGLHGRRKRTTLAEIATKVGVSRQVVAAVLNPERVSSVRFSEETRWRVLAAVEASDWRPNRTAKSLANRRHAMLGILVGNFGNIPRNVLPHMMTRARHYGQVLTLDSLGGGEQDAPLFVREDSVDAVVVFEDIPAPLKQHIERIGLPCVQVNTNVRDQPGCVTFDEEGAMRKVAGHFAATGRYRTLLFHGDPDRGYWVRARMNGLRQAAADVGMRDPYFVQFESYLYNPAYYRAHVETIKRVLREHPRIDSVILPQDLLAPMFYHAAEELGRRIPRDIAAAAVHDTGVARLLAPTLTTLHMHADELGQYIIDVANGGIDNEEEYRSPAVVPYDLLVWGSSAEAQDDAVAPDGRASDEGSGAG
jgi:LacI family transcriptional regulator